MVLRTLLGHQTVAIFASAIALGAIGSAHASEPTAQSVPRLEIGIGLELESDTGARSDDQHEKLTDVYNTSSFSIGLYLSENLSVKSALTFEPVRDPRPGKDRFLSDHGLYVEELYLHFEPGPLGIVIGKYNPAFGVAWDKAPGIFGTDLAEDYQLTERLGAALSAALSLGPLGQTEVVASAFNLDTSQLSSSVFTKRDRAHGSDGGPGNADALSSFAIAATGTGLLGQNGLGWHIAYRRLARGETPDDLNGEHGFAAALFGDYEIGDGRSINWIGEYVRLDGADGASQTLDYFTVGAGMTIDRLSLSVAATQRLSGTPAETSHRDRLITATAGYEVLDGWQAELGWKLTDIENIDTHTIGLKVSKEFDFSLPLR